ncbi:Crp/Fnr family transcriptional regulator [Sinomicrobium weinanense]|uniref:Crp/Fnr family transcriptional regulator n=1 Tax=Sinomicrobium weinanense TaxID=2842200 RepID=A0A926Q5K4_9FLAO|nr:Crp/Fnr family transcriptional regulator [Sinomicrobium weinanense]MBC9798070.1 Crp/Fnr family transcriptional regulator [Sinomicrobium weinanense]MBU3122517.1 Crp/Fnr family transcriptional regulator [Sinomicrobium weinanense]
MEEQLRKYFGRYVALDDAEFNMLLTKLEYKKYGRKGHLLEQGEVCRFNYFILKGLVRTYYFDKEGKDRITRFAIENWWVTQMESFVSESPSKLFMQAIEETEVLRISRKNLEALYVSVPKLERAFRIITQNMLIAIQRRNDFYSQLNSKDRYFNFVQSLPDFAQRIPQYMIASYLDISPEYLSTIRKF